MFRRFPVDTRTLAGSPGTAVPYTTLSSPGKGFSSSEYPPLPLCQQRSFFYTVQPLSPLSPFQLGSQVSLHF